MAGDWTIERVIFAPARVAELLNQAEDRATTHNKRVNELLEANNRYLDRARVAEAALAARPATEALTAATLADALSCFWNDAIGEAHQRQTAMSMDVATVMAVGLAAVARRLQGEI